MDSSGNNKKDSLFLRLRSLAREASYFSIHRVRAAIGADNLNLSPDLLREYLSEAMAKGLIHDAGRGWYSSLAEQAVLDGEPVRPLREALAKRFPFLPHYVWSTQQINPWMHHQLGKFVAFVFADGDGADDVAAWLRSEGWVVTLNPTAKSARDFAPGERSVVVRGIRREFDPAAEPKIDTVLVDLLLENGRLGLMDEGEFQELCRNLLTSKRVEMAGLLGRLRDHKRSWEELVGNAGEPIIAEI